VVNDASIASLAAAELDGIAAPRTARVRVVHTDGMWRVLAMEDIGHGELILEIKGVLVDQPSRYTVQIGEGVHIAPAPGRDDPSRGDDPPSYPWQFLNHSCDPNAVIAGTNLVAHRRIDAGQEVTFDYNTTEYEMATPFACQCQACGDGGSLIAGFRFLPTPRQREMYPRLAEHLRRKLGGSGAT
jgi:hypothetical protein